MTTPTEILPTPPYSVYPAIRLTTTPYPEASEWGLGRRETDPNALFTFENWQASVPNDSFAIYWGNSPIPLAQDIVKNIANRYNLPIPGTKIPEGEFEVVGEVTRAASGQLATSFPQKYLVKTQRPGGLTFWASEQHHRGLHLTIEGFTEGSLINQANTKAGLWCLIKPYENIRKNDTITVAYGAFTIDHIVSPVEAAGTAPIRVFISPQVIQQGNQFGPIGIAFMVRDVVNNVSGETYAYSKPYILEGELDPTLLKPPVFSLDGTNTSTVNLDEKSQQRYEARVVLPTDPLGPTPPNQIVLILKATQKTQSGQSSKTVRLPAVIDTNMGVEIIAIPGDLIASITDGTLQISFEWQAADGTLLNHSGTTEVRVKGTADLKLPAPAFEHKPGPQTIAPENYPKGAVVAVKYQGMNATQVIRLNWTFANGSGAVVPVQSGNASGTVLFDISAQLISQSMGQVVMLSYEVTTKNKTSVSDSQKLKVQGKELVNDTSTFNDGSYAGWERGPAGADPRNLKFVGESGKLILFNNTFNNKSAGVLLKKRFTNLRAGNTYVFSVQVGRWSEDYAYPIGFLQTSQGERTTPLTITTQYPLFQSMSLSFVAQSTDIELMYVSDQATGVGNDYVLRNFVVERT
ncbi:hypothetical protein [Pseudomonas trivialis]|uniref:CBM-cenC domain-containing protein n=1 Tax=Pseudomonas trivialis TaxID=200450 RepID=A0A0R2ZBZ6_9PSED|nr:hypothetical protein [Pseudomonas trivialis]KRP58082.1 hypothetical protein TU79_21480 [Pseudomonas trivialis]SDS14399.1 hypothetical protein SAMN04490205_1613 [Pseudomonas trivialis]